jgi:hypothetical protein
MEDRVTRATRLVMAGLIAAALVFSTLSAAGAATKTSANLKLRGHLRAIVTLKLTSGDGGPYPVTCQAYPPAKVQRKTAGKWRTVAKGRMETSSRIRFDLDDRAGKYRAVVPGKDDCLKGVSAIATHRH